MKNMKENLLQGLYIYLVWLAREASFILWRKGKIIL